MLRVGVLVGASLLVVPGLARAAPGVSASPGERRSRLDAAWSIGAGPALQLGGYLPNVLSVGGTATLMLRTFGDDGWGGGLTLTFTYLRTVTPATLYGAEVEGAYANGTVGVCIRRIEPFGFCGGWRMPGGAYFPRTPGATWEHGWRTSGSLNAGVDMLITLADRLSLRPILTLDVYDWPTRLIVNKRRDPEWRSFPLFATLSVELTLDFWKRDKPTPQSK
ncbi:hypothetical protein [Polyangium fumosum]|uniref:Outer membrane protein beta-barrel domain-containing protein n=1 Tax=Polyangium fumosum TaxID=889272 RepID=A0A4U1J9T0_9BACT|nr:hypothetical protein [Polyangium fumosum]TKD05178.1 hypothetical protein E8A74_21810 [Polyangium fumosum]